MLKPAQRVNNPKAVQSSFLAPQDKVTELARGGSIADLISEEPSPNHKVTMSFYRTGDVDEGLQTVTIQVDQTKSDNDLFWKIVKDYRIPIDYHFELLNRIRIANHTEQPSVRHQLLIIRFISIVIMGKLLTLNQKKQLISHFIISKLIPCQKQLLKIVSFYMNLI